MGLYGEPIGAGQTLSQPTGCHPRRAESSCYSPERVSRIIDLTSTLPKASSTPDAGLTLPLNHGRLATGRLGAAVLQEGVISASVSSFASFCGALVPLLAAALAPHHRWVSILAAEIALAVLGSGLALVLHGRVIRWSLGLVLGGLALSLTGAYLKIA